MYTVLPERILTINGGPKWKTNKDSGHLDSEALMIKAYEVVIESHQCANKDNFLGETVMGVYEHRNCRDHYVKIMAPMSDLFLSIIEVF